MNAQLWDDDGKLRIRYTDNNDVNHILDYPTLFRENPGTFVHIVITIEDGSVKLYINGLLYENRSVDSNGATVGLVKEEGYVDNYLDHDSTNKQSQTP